MKFGGTNFFDETKTPVSFVGSTDFIILKKENAKNRSTDYFWCIF
jgi:hypothetical protein